MELQIDSLPALRSALELGGGFWRRENIHSTFILFGKTSLVFPAMGMIFCSLFNFQSVQLLRRFFLRNLERISAVVSHAKRKVAVSYSSDALYIGTVNVQSPIRKHRKL